MYSTLSYDPTPVSAHGHVNFADHDDLDCHNLAYMILWYLDNGWQTLPLSGDPSYSRIPTTAPYLPNPDTYH